MLRIELPGDVREALSRLAMREFRDPPSQASVVIADHLRELGLLKRQRREPRDRGDNPKTPEPA